MRRKALMPENIALLPEGGGWLLVEFGADTVEEASQQARGLMAALGSGNGTPDTRLFEDRALQARIWRVRESGQGAASKVPGLPDEWSGWEDSSVPPEKVSAYLRDFRSLLNKYGYHAAFFGHFGQGCVHSHIDFDLETADGVRKFRSFLYEAADVVLG